MNNSNTSNSRNDPHTQTSSTKEELTSNTLDPNHPILTQEDLNERKYQCVSGKYFTEDGKYVPLSNRPARSTQENVLKNHPTVLDVVICGFSTFVYVTDLSEKQAIGQILNEEVGEVYTKKVEVKSHRQEAEYMLDFRPEGY